MILLNITAPNRQTFINASSENELDAMLAAAKEAIKSTKVVTITITKVT